MQMFTCILLIFLLVCAVAVSFSKNLLNSIIIYMSFGVVMSVFWMILESPDLAITEAAVGAGITSILFFVTLKKIQAITAEVKGKDDDMIYEADFVLERPHSKVPSMTAQLFKRLYRMMGLVFCVIFISFMISSVAELPIVGEANKPVNNEVSERYIEEGMKETGSVNLVTGMILDYRAFDTLGESHVLFVATVAVLILLRVDNKHKLQKKDYIAAEAMHDRMLEPKNDPILQVVAKVLVPPIFIFGIYVVLFGHLGPGGGFSGGAIIGAGLILYLSAFGFEKTERFFKASTYKKTSFAALACYCLCKSYSFYTGANHIHSIIPLGTPGNILSSGLILILNICVGVVVAGTMYTFYVMFRKGGY